MKRDGEKKIFRFGLLFATLTIFFITVTFYYFTNSNFFNIPEISTQEAFISLLLIALFFWLSEITGMIFQFNSFINFEAMRRTSSIMVFVTISLVFYNFLSFNLYLFFISLMYFSEVCISFFNREKLNI